METSKIFSLSQNNLNVIKNKSFIFYELYNNKVLSSSMYANGLNNQHNRIQRGRRPLVSRDECDLYTSLYGGKHFYKLLSAFKASKIEFCSKKLEINDYACGQGYASFIFLENLAKENRLSQIKDIKIRFIDLSPIAIDVATDYINLLQNHYACLKKIKIRIIKKELDLNNISNIKISNSDKNSSKIHLFSNILDIIGIDKVNIAKHIMENYNGYNYFICVSPSYPSAETGINQFASSFDNLHNTIDVRNIDRNSNILLKGKEYNFLQRQWKNAIIKRVEKQFYINNL